MKRFDCGWWMGIVLVMLGTAGAVSAARADDAAWRQDGPPCAVVATFAALRAVGIDVTAEEVLAQLGARSSHTMADVCDAVEAFGAWIEPVHLSLDELRDASASTSGAAWILPVRQRSLDVNHCLTVLGATDALFAVAQYPDGLAWFDRAVLDAQWTGDAIVVRRTAPRGTRRARTVVGMLLLMVGGVLWARHAPARRVRRIAARRAATAGGAFLAALLVVPAAPCRADDVVSTSTVSCGVIEATALHDVDVTVAWTRPPEPITAIRVSCGACVAVLDAPEQLRPDAPAQVAIRLTPEGRLGPQHFWVAFDGADGAPLHRIQLDATIRGARWETPRVHFGRVEPGAIADRVVTLETYGYDELCGSVTSVTGPFRARLLPPMEHDDVARPWRRVRVRCRYDAPRVLPPDTAARGRAVFEITECATAHVIEVPRLEFTAHAAPRWQATPDRLAITRHGRRTVSVHALRVAPTGRGTLRTPSWQITAPAWMAVLPDVARRDVWWLHVDTARLPAGVRTGAIEFCTDDGAVALRVPWTVVLPDAGPAAHAPTSAHPHPVAATDDDDDVIAKYEARIRAATLTIDEVSALVHGDPAVTTGPAAQLVARQRRLLAAWESTRDVPWAIDAIAALFAARRDRLTRYDAQWRMQRRVDRTASAGLFTAPDALYDVERTVRFAVDGAQMLHRAQQHAIGDAATAVDTARLFDGAHEYVHVANARTATVQWPDDLERYALTDEPWPAVAGLIGARARFTAAARERDLAALLRDERTVAWVDADPIVVAGRPAIVINVGLGDALRIALDPARGLAPLRVDDVLTINGQRVRVRTEMLELREVTPGCWLPRRVERTQARLAETGEARPPYLRETWTLTALRVDDDVDSSVFDPAHFIPSGTLVLDRITGESWLKDVAAADFFATLRDDIDHFTTSEDPP